MISSRLLMVGVMALSLFVAISCAGAGQLADSNPASPDLTRDIESMEAGHYLWAYYEIAVDPVENTFEITPLRQVADHWNVLGFLEKGPCTTCVTILGMANSAHGTKLFDVKITHPFTSANLTGFDVRGIAMFAGSHTFPVSGLSTPNRKAGDGELYNAEGYTTLYNGTTAGSGPGGTQGYIKGKYTPPMTPNALLNGYIRHSSPGMTNTRNMFYAGTAIIETYDIDMPDSTFIFGYAVDASWAKPTVKPVTDPASHFPPQANCPEPWKIEVAEEAIGQGLHDEGGQTKLLIDVYDYQGKNSFFTPKVECPEIFNGAKTASWILDGTGYTRYQIILDNEKIAAQGQYKCLISVQDTENATAPDWLDLTAYQIFPLTVADFIPQANQPPTAAAHASNTNPLVNVTVNFFDDSTDPDGASDIIKWEWDFSFDVVDGFQPGSEEQNPSIKYSTAGTYLVQLRVTDSQLHTDMLNTPLTIVVSGGGGGNVPPIACADADIVHPNVNTLVRFYDCSIDEDGFNDIVYWEWDLDGDGLYEKTIKDTTKIYNTGGDYLVQHRVTDTASNKDTLDTPLLIEVNGPPVAAAEADKYNITMGELVTITNTSSDNDGNGPIINIYWDTNGNGSYNDPTDIKNQQQIQLQFYQGGIAKIGLKVEDAYGLSDTLDTPLEITVEGFDPFCVDLIDQWNSADHLFKTRAFEYYNSSIGGLSGLNYQDIDGPWDFTVVPPSAPAICNWHLPTSSQVPSGAKNKWPNADFFFKEDAPASGGSQFVPHKFDFVDSLNGDLVMEGQYQDGNIFDYGNTFKITHPICKGWTDSGAGSGVFSSVNFSITWNMVALGTGPALFVVNGDPVVLNCMLIRHHIYFVDTDFGYFSFSLLNYQWIDSEGNEVAFMQADNGLSGNNYSSNTYTGTVICRSLKTIS